MYNAAKYELLSSIHNQLATITTLVNHQAQNGPPMGKRMFNYPGSWHQGSIFYGNLSYIQEVPQDFHNQGSSSLVFLYEEHHPSLEDNLNAFVFEARRRMDYLDSQMENLESIFSDIEATCASMNATLKTLETLVGKPVGIFSGLHLMLSTTE